MIIGAWCRNPSIKDINAAHALGIRRLDFMVNDLSKRRTPSRFEMDRPGPSLEHALTLGIEVHFTSWIMPHVAFCTEAGDELQQLCLDTGAAGVVLDAEEPWTLAKQPDREGAAIAFADAMKGCRWGVTGIGFADRGKLAPLGQRADYGIPQAYVTSTSGLRVEAIDNVMAHWNGFVPRTIPGLAAYRTDRSEMRACIKALGHECDTVIYWALRHIVRSPSARAVIREATGR